MVVILKTNDQNYLHKCMYLILTMSLFQDNGTDHNSTLKNAKQLVCDLIKSRFLKVMFV